jgi:universal stress protein A
MSEPSPTDQPPIVVGVGLTAESQYVLEKVCGLAGGPERIMAVYALDPTVSYFQFDPSASDAVAGSMQNVRREAQEQLQSLCSVHGISRFTVMEGKPAEVLHEAAAAEGASTVAVGSHGHRGWRALLGETASAVLHGANCNVLAVLTKDRETPPALSYQRILMAVDMTDETEGVIAAALALRERFDAELSIMTAIKPLTQSYPGLDLSTMSASEAGFETEAISQYTAALAALCERHGISGGYSVGHGPAAEEIHRAAAEQGADLVVLGSHGRHGLQLIQGSTPNAVLHGMTCDVYAVRL